MAMNPFWIPLGKGKALALGVGNKAGLLDQAGAKGFAVPKGLLLCHEAYLFALKSHWIEQKSGQIKIIQPEALAQALQLPTLKSPVAVRSAFSAEDNLTDSKAGFFHSELNVPFFDSNAFFRALEVVWTSALRYDRAFRMDVLVLEMVEARFAGVAFTENDFEDDLINYTEGLADKLVGGKTEGKRLELPKLYALESPSPGFSYQESFEPRLQKLLRSIRQTFGYKDWDIEWADDGKKCWLIQLRPITRRTLRNDAFTIANHKEILPELPSYFMTALIESCAENLFEYYRQFDPSLPVNRLFIEVFYGRPLINLSLLTDMMRHWGLPTKLVTDSIGGEDDRPFPINKLRLAKNIPKLLKLGLAQQRAAGHAEATIQKILESTSNLRGHKWGFLIDSLQFVYSTLVTEMFSLTAAMSLPLALSRKLDAGHPYFMEHQALSTQFYTDLQPLWQYIAEHPDLKAHIQAGLIPQDPAFLKHYTAFISKHGHRGVYESDLARPRYREQPELLLQILLNPLPPKPQKEVKTSVWDTILAPLWKQGAKAVRAREELRYQTMQAFARIRAAMLNLAEYAVREGIFRERDDIWKLNVLEIRRLDIGWKPDDTFWKSRHEEIEENARVHMSDLFRRFDDFFLMESPHLTTGFPQELKGMPLTQGYVEGRAWVLNEPKFALPPNFIREKTILIARSVDAGWIPVFGLVAGVVVETGGDLSHGSIILRELGIPAVTNVSQATRLIPQGSNVILWAEKGKLQVLT